MTAIPPSYCCPISRKLMRDPVRISTGETFERESIEEFFLYTISNPFTGNELDNSNLQPNRALKRLIRSYVKKHNYVSCIPYDIEKELYNWFKNPEEVDVFFNIFERYEKPLLSSYGPFSRNILHYCGIYLPVECVCEVLRFLEGSCDISKLLLQKDSKKRTPLEYSIFYGDEEFSKFRLVSSYIEGEVTKTEYLSKIENGMLQFCSSCQCKLGDVKRVSILFNLGVKPNDKYETLYHLEIAAGYSNSELLRYMLEYGKEKGIDMKKACDDALVASSANGLVASAELLIDIGEAGINEKCRNFRRFCSFPLSSCCFYGHIDFAKYLTTRNVDVNQVYLGSNSLCAACSSNNPNIEVVKLLINSGAHVNPDLSTVLESPLQIASKRGNVELIKVLLSFGADVNAKNQTGTTSLHLATKYRNLDVIEVLLQNGALYELKNNDKENCLEVISDINYRRIVKNKIKQMNSRKFDHLLEIPKEFSKLKETITKQQFQLEKQKEEIELLKSVLKKEKIMK